MTKHIAVICFPETLGISASAICDAAYLTNLHIQRRSALVEHVPPPLKVTLASLRGGALTLANGQTLSNVEPLGQIASADLVYLAGVGVVDPEALFAGRFWPPELLTWLAARGAEGALMAASGPSVAILAEAGLASEAIAAPSWAWPSLRARYPGLSIEKEDIIIGKRVMTSRSVGMEPKFVHHLIRQMFTPYTADWLATVGGLDAPNNEDETAEADRIVRVAKAWLNEKLAHPVSMGELSSYLAVSERTLRRHFLNATGQTPLGYLQTLRIDTARTMLIRTERSIIRIANLVGYRNLRFFHDLFKLQTGMSPGAYRRAAGDKPFYRTALDY
ncbi:MULTISPECIES: GlxA family transcriptional regulator [unclassified Sphingobium]|uniref:GlxA family transcriptional regulator n=1 Tax=unclassified Sphingobium TaxID=2611147 RepID=UPI0011990E5F|nr:MULTISPECIES: helix-turn-helix domain-containing protein [unclassified Sphingobium]MBG6119941.1 transcriptional regulator GlxA family with amidase domain [Sphingobium sp. JAI105]TWC99620.1 AraC family transcriptional regulator with amidase-like domain [Sphingobium sp. AEW010]TWD21814.1 AraC family transcriptional regulator with amidase-like domain [Sphingobium sp. AEW001]